MTKDKIADLRAPVCNFHAAERAVTDLAPRCATAMRRLSELTPTRQLEQVCDTRALHADIFAGMAPAPWPDAAGTYRGTPGSSVADAPRAVFLARRLPGLRSRDMCLPAAEVPQAMEALAQALRCIWEERPGHDTPCRDAGFVALSEVTARFFAIHPYMDGNGHIWRLVLPVLAGRLGLVMRAEWTIERRPYGPEFSLALQWHDDHPGILADHLRRWLIVPSATP